MIVNPPVAVATPASELVTVTLRAPVPADPAIETLAVIDVALATVTLLTVIPEPEKDTVAPTLKPVPANVTF
ncbi:MAG: hypothetical protein ACLP50_02730 [Solirubrobacteraceae bacterium]